MLNNSTSPSTVAKCSLEPDMRSIAMTTFLIVILIVTFIGNLLVILAVIFFRRLRSITNYFIVSLAVSDFLIALLSLPFRIDQSMHNAYWCLPLEVCQFWLVVDTTCTFASMWNLVIISIDRFIVITRPYKYHSVMTNKIGYVLISSVWIFSLFMSLMMFINWSGLPTNFDIDRECSKRDPIYYTVVPCLAFFLPLLIIIFMYGNVFMVAFNHMKSLASLQIDSGNRPRNGARKINLIREMKAAKTLAVVIGCFILCWFPFNVIILVFNWDVTLNQRINRDVIYGLAMVFIYVLPVINSTLNPIIYALMNREFRSAFRNLGRRMTGRRLGAVGGDKTFETTTTRSCSILNDDHTMDPYGAMHFSDNDSEASAHQLPNINSKNDQNHEQLNAGNNNSNTSHDPPVQEEKSTKIREDTAMPTQNGHLSTSADCTDVTQSDNNSTQHNHDVTPYINDVTNYENDVIENVNALSCSPTELSPLKGSPASSLKNESGASRKFDDSLPPIESRNALEVDGKDEIKTKSSSKILKVSPSPDCSRKNTDEVSISENVPTDNTVL